MKKNILLTGFKFIESGRIEITEKFLKNHSVSGESYLHSKIFPAHIFFDEAEDFGNDIVRIANKIKADAIISLMMDPSVKGLRLEKWAINWSVRINSLGGTEKLRLTPTQPPWDSRGINLEHWNQPFITESLKDINIKFEADVFPDVIKSQQDYGNALMYRTLTALGPANRIPYIFLRVPCTAEAAAIIPDLDPAADLITMEILEKIISVFTEERAFNKS